MSRLFPHSAYAEDQLYPRAILTTHVLHRGFQAGTLVGSVIGVGRYFVLRRRLAGSVVPNGLFAASVLRSAGVGSVIGTAFLAVGLANRMFGRDEIEWADRSWRLLENKGQVEVDDWSLGGAAAGVAGVALVGSKSMIKASVWKSTLGGLGIGSLLGVGGYMVWRHGINNGKRDDVETEK